MTLDNAPNLPRKVIVRSGNRSNDSAERTITSRRTEVRALLPLSIVGQKVLSVIVRSVMFSIRTNDYFLVYFLNKQNYTECQTPSKGAMHV